MSDCPEDEVEWFAAWRAEHYRDAWAETTRSVMDVHAK